jgi:hypothetical protein
MDRTASPDVWNYQKKVAALLALTIPVSNVCMGNCCNKFIFNIFYEKLALLVNFLWLFVVAIIEMIIVKDAC